MKGSEIKTYLIENMSNLTLATADEDGVPWVSPLFFVPDDEHNCIS